MKKQLKGYFAIILCFAMVTFWGCGDNDKKESVKATPSGVTYEEPAASDTAQEILTDWTDGNNSVKQKIVNYVEAVTDEGSTDFIPKEDRIAAFDMDGTILCEKPTAMDFAVAVYRIQNDLKDNKELNAKVDKLLKEFQMSPTPDDMWTLYGEVTAQAFQGMTGDEITNYVSDYLKKQDSNYDGRKLTDTFYKPMIELFSYLKANDFDIYLVSGSSQEIIWGCVKAFNDTYPEQQIEVDRAHMIGSEMQVVPSGNTKGNSSYVFQPEDKVVRGSEAMTTDINMLKVTNLYRRVGKVPVLCGGNTDGDFSMLNYAKSSPYKNMSILIWHDDDRECVYNTSDEWKELVGKYDWQLVSMKKEFKNVFMK